MPSHGEDSRASSLFQGFVPWTTNALLEVTSHSQYKADIHPDQVFHARTSYDTEVALMYWINPLCALRIMAISSCCCISLFAFQNLMLDLLSCLPRIMYLSFLSHCLFHTQFHHRDSVLACIGKHLIVSDDSKRKVSGLPKYSPQK